jgi:DHA2 family multidrug resistance protein
LGFLTCALTLYWLSRLTLDAGYWDLFWPQFVQGISLGLLFVPLTTITMARISNERMGNATSLFNLMRNIGGSIGIATTTTVLERHNQLHSTYLGEHVTRFHESSRAVLESLQRGFESLGSDSYTATQRAYAALHGMISQQAAMLSFIDAFRLLALIFVVLTPLVILMRRPPVRG